MPAGRAVVTSTGMPAILIKLDHYSTKKEYADMASESKQYYEDLAVNAGITMAGAALSPFASHPVPVSALVRSASADTIAVGLMSADDLRARSMQ